jgi:hypothetical protein
MTVRVTIQRSAPVRVTLPAPLAARIRSALAHAAAARAARKGAK